jgi:hypothetical protein
VVFEHSGGIHLHELPQPVLKDDPRLRWCGSAALAS